MGLPVLFGCILMVLLAAGPSISAQTVTGMVGQSVTLPCMYSVKNGVTSMCWGRGWCPLNGCSNEIIWTDGHKMTFQHSNRYHLKENVSQGIVSLTIMNLTEADSGTYCCRVEISGWFNDQKVTVKLKVEQVSSTPVLDIVTTTSPSEISDGKNGTQPDIPIGVNDTVTGTSEGYQYENKTVILHEQLVTSNNKGIYIGVGVFVGVLLILILLLFVLKRYFYSRKNAPALSLTFLAGSKNEVGRTATEDSNRAEDNVYTVEDNVYMVEEENAYIVEDENPYVVPTNNGKQQPSKVWP